MLNSPLKYLGGKSRLRKYIIPLIPEHICYCEVFAGGAWVLFGKDPNISKVEVLNDIWSELINFYHVLKYKPVAFLEAFDWIFVSRQTFEKFKREDSSQLNDVEQAMRFFYKMKASYGAKSTFFPANKSNRINPNLTKINDIIPAIHKRLKAIIIENLDFDECIQKYDKSTTFYYIDPPCYKSQAKHTHHFKEEDFVRLAEILKSIKGKFLLSINNHPFIKELFYGYDFKEVPIKYSLPRINSGKELVELLIKNY